ncbi:MAG: alpha/beta hydrolase [Ruminococcaceae bacterium]|nr:alpha/beta hydrolase [Oscillospiraceae bacterium]
MTSLEKLITILAVLLVSAVLLSVLEHKLRKRSLVAALVCLGLRIINPPHSEKDAKRRLRKYGKKNACPYKLPHINKRGIHITECSVAGIQCFVFESAGAGENVIYLHGGAYVRNPRISHIRYLIRLAKIAKIRIFMPLYPKAPFYCADKTRDRMLEFYRELLPKTGTPVLMGDSSGGGLAMLLCAEIGRNGLRVPRKLILFSPWVDVSLDNPDILRYESLDPLISLSEVKYYGKVWAGDEDVYSPRVSPIFESERHLPKSYIFAGGRELICPDLIRLHERLDFEGVEHSFILRAGMNHVYQIYPIPEARAEVKLVSEIINNRG